LKESSAIAIKQRGDSSMPHRRSPEKLKAHRERWQEIVFREQNRPRYNISSSFTAKQFRAIPQTSSSPLFMKHQRNAIGVCVFCGSLSNLHVHHKNRNRKDNRPENLIVLCQKCHTEEHHN
jgi:5-methylcytosine-specific restriction endonuclease McrA